MSHNTKPLVSDLIDKAWQCIISLGRAKKTTYIYKCYGISPVTSYFSVHSVSVYSEDEGNNCIWHYFPPLSGWRDQQHKVPVHQENDHNYDQYHEYRKLCMVL